jgi:hypothetical protein
MTSQRAALSTGIFKRRSLLFLVGGFLVALGIVLGVRLHGPDRGYRVDLQRSGASTSSGTRIPLLVGAGVREVTPRLGDYDSWTDADGDGLFDTARGDRHEDRNRNGRVDLVWLAGFAPNRPARGVSDPLWSRVVVLRQGALTVALASIDCIGLTHEWVIALRRSLPAELGVTHVIVAATHTHHGPDTLNLWSGRPLLFSHFDRHYLDRLQAETRAAIRDAVGALAPAAASSASLELPVEGFVRDTRPPYVYDRTLCAARFSKAGTDETIATLVSWGNHAEALGERNTLVSSDYPHAWREGVERGLPGPDERAGLGGLCLYFAGPVGGLMTPLNAGILDRHGREPERHSGRALARALGDKLAAATIGALRAPSVRPLEAPRLSLVAQTVFIPMSGTLRWPIMLGLIHPGWYWGRVRSEVDALAIGDIELLALPGEPYPELIDGGVESPSGADYPAAPIETPAIRSLMTGRLEMVIGLANDELGYFIPRTQWDARAPFTYGQQKAPYGELLSPGPDAAPVLHQASRDTLRRLHAIHGARSAATP